MSISGTSKRQTATPAEIAAAKIICEAYDDPLRLKGGRCTYPDCAKAPSRRCNPWTQTYIARAVIRSLVQPLSAEVLEAIERVGSLGVNSIHSAVSAFHAAIDAASPPEEV